MRDFTLCYTHAVTIRRCVGGPCHSSQVVLWLIRAISCSYNRASTSIDLPLPSCFHFHRPSTSILLSSISHPIEPHPRNYLHGCGSRTTSRDRGGVVSTRLACPMQVVKNLAKVRPLSTNIMMRTRSCKWNERPILGARTRDTRRH